MTDTAVLGWREDAGAERYHEIDRLYRQLSDHRFAMESIQLALVAVERYDPNVHKLTSHFPSYLRFFKEVAMPEYLKCRNPRSAAQALNILLSEREG